MEQQGNIVREYGENYTCIPSDILHDKRVNLKCRGIYATIMGFPKDWQFSVNGLKAIIPDGRDAIYSALKTLESYGYIQKTQNNANGCFGLVEYHVFAHGSKTELKDIPHTKVPLTENPYTVKPLTENPYTENPIQYNNLSNIISKDSIEEKPKAKPKEALSMDFDMADGYLDLMTEWVEYKRRIKHPYKTQTGLVQCYNRLYKLSGGNVEIAKEIINQSIAFEWQGLFELKNYGTSNRVNYNSKQKQRELDTIARRAEILQVITSSTENGNTGNEQVQYAGEF